jgi:hypothetical protein
LAVLASPELIAADVFKVFIIIWIISTLLISLGHAIRSK